MASNAEHDARPYAPHSSPVLQVLGHTTNMHSEGWATDAPRVPVGVTIRFVCPIAEAAYVAHRSLSRRPHAVLCALFEFTLATLAFAFHNEWRDFVLAALFLLSAAVAIVALFRPTMATARVQLRTKIVYVSEMYAVAVCGLSCAAAVSAALRDHHTVAAVFAAPAVHILRPRLVVALPVLLLQLFAVAAVAFGASPRNDPLSTALVQVMHMALLATAAAVVAVTERADRAHFIGTARARHTAATAAARRSNLEALTGGLLPPWATARLRTAVSAADLSVTDRSTAAVGLCGFVDFQRWSTSLLPAHIVVTLHRLFVAFDRAALRFGVAKISAAADTYAVTIGLGTEPLAAVGQQRRAVSEWKERVVAFIAWCVHDGPAESGLEFFDVTAADPASPLATVSSGDTNVTGDWAPLAGAAANPLAASPVDNSAVWQEAPPTVALPLRGAVATGRLAGQLCGHGSTMRYAVSGPALEAARATLATTQARQVTVLPVEHDQWQEPSTKSSPKNSPNENPTIEVDAGAPVQRRETVACPVDAAVVEIDAATASTPTGKSPASNSKRNSGPSVVAATTTAGGGEEEAPSPVVNGHRPFTATTALCDSVCLSFPDPSLARSAALFTRTAEAPAMRAVSLCIAALVFAAAVIAVVQSTVPSSMDAYSSAAGSTAGRALAAAAIVGFTLRGLAMFLADASTDCPVCLQHVDYTAVTVLWTVAVSAVALQGVSVVTADVTFLVVFAAVVPHFFCTSGAWLVPAMLQAVVVQGPLIVVGALQPRRFDSVAHFAAAAVVSVAAGVAVRYLHARATAVEFATANGLIETTVEAEHCAASDTNALRAALPKHMHRHVLPAATRLDLTVPICDRNPEIPMVHSFWFDLVVVRGRFVPPPVRPGAAANIAWAASCGARWAALYAAVARHCPNGELEVIEGLGDDFTIAGPFPKPKRDPCASAAASPESSNKDIAPDACAVSRACVCALDLLRSLHYRTATEPSLGPPGIQAALATGAAFTTLIGGPAPSVRIVGAAVREADSVLNAGALPAGTAVFAAPGFRRAHQAAFSPCASMSPTRSFALSGFGPNFGSKSPIAVDVPPEGNDTFGPPKRWRLHVCGVLMVSSVVL